MASLSRSLFGHLIPAYGVLEHGSHCTPLERGDLDISYSIDIVLRRSELLVERTIPTWIMGCISYAKMLFRGLLNE